jgi:hypothetical protein
MKPTQQQIEAALAYAMENETAEQWRLVNEYRPLYMGISNAIAILAAAYREAIAENQELKAAILKLNQP